MTADASRLMRPGVAAQDSITRTTTEEYCQAGLNSRIELPLRVRQNKAGPYEDTSRMKGNFHVRFLEGGGLVTARSHSASH